jgi:hypothetical protein
MTPLQRLQTLAALVQFHELPTIYTLTIESNGLAGWQMHGEGCGLKLVCECAPVVRPS